MNPNTALMPLSEVKEIAAQVVKSNIFGLPNEAAAFALMMICQSEGLHPMQAMKRYHIIKGRASMRADAMMAEFQAKGGTVRWITRTNTECKAEFSHPTGGTVEVEWTIAMAKDAGLLARNDVWKQFPRQMLTARVISEGVRTILPGIVCGLYTPEELKSGMVLVDDDQPAGVGGIAAALKAKSEAVAVATVVEVVKPPVPEIEDAEVVPPAAVPPTPPSASPAPAAAKPAESATPPSTTAEDGAAPSAAQHDPSGFDRQAAVMAIVEARNTKNINTAKFTQLCAATIGRPEKAADKWSDEECAKILAAVQGV
jgi:hypothetical protein